MMGRIVGTLAAALIAAALGGCTRRPPKLTPATQVSQVQQSASPAVVDSLWAQGERYFRAGKWSDAATTFERVNLELPPGDPRIARSHFYLGESYLARGEELQAARELRKVSDDTPNDPLAPDALLRVGDAYAELWRKPELDPTYGETARATYQELLNRFPGSEAAVKAQQRIAELQEKFAYKQYRSAVYYLRLKAYDSAILYLKDLVATYPKTSIVPQALLDLVHAYRVLGYQEDVKETCDYLRRFHDKASGVAEACPAPAASEVPAPSPAPAATPGQS
jgi:outer membrane protein assembly factor BamD